jgi:hypothetical protein
MCYVEQAVVTIDFPKLTDYEDCKPMLEHINKVVLRELGVEPKIEIIGVKK